jgi:outer membrane receptor protein involved in Fe transport
VVLDEAGLTPVRGALVAVHNLGRSVRTDEDGRFTLLDLQAGVVDLRVESEGYVTVVESAEIAPQEASLIHFHLTRVTVLLDSLLVAVGARTVDGRERGHSEGSIVVGDTDLRTAADLLIASVPGLSARRPDGAMGTALTLQFRGVSSFELSSEPHIYLDDVRIDGGGAEGAMTVLDQIPASAVKRIRVLRGPASAGRYPNAAAGVILLETVGP